MKNRTHQKKPQWRSDLRVDEDGHRSIEWYARIGRNAFLMVRQRSDSRFAWRVDGQAPTGDLFHRRGEAHNLFAAQRTAREVWWGIAEHESWSRFRAERLRSGHRREWRRGNRRIQRPHQVVVSPDALRVAFAWGTLLVPASVFAHLLGGARAVLLHTKVTLASDL